MKRRLIRLALLGWLAVPLAGQAGDAWTVRLEKALPFGKESADLVVELPAQAKGRAWAWSPALPGQEHPGELTKWETREGVVRGQVRFDLSHERARGRVTLGGSASFEFELRQTGQAWAGSFQGQTQASDSPELRERLERAWGWGLSPQTHGFLQPLIANRLHMALASSNVSGRVTGRVGPAPLAGFELTVPKEHPRLFFRKTDLERLRQWAGTPEGTKILARLQELLDTAANQGFGFQSQQAEHMQYGLWAAGHGLLYQLSGDKKHANRALGLGVGAMYAPYYYGGGGIHPYQIMGLALAYDLCQEAWPADYRAMVYSFLFQNVRDLAMRHDEVDLLGTRRLYGFANDQQNFALESARDFNGIKLRAAAVLAALAITGDSVPVYKPVPLASVRAVAPASGYQPWAGVPVVPFTDGRMPAQWLVNGPFRRGLMPDPLLELGGMAQARPEPGTKVTHDGVPLDFRWYWPAGQGDKIRGPRIYPRDCGRFWTSSTGGGYYPGIALVQRWRERLGQDVGLEIALYTVLENDRERVIQARPNWGWNSHGIRMWLNGVEVRDGDLVRLQPGLYPIMCQVPVMGGYANQGPNLREYTAEMQAQDLADWERAQAAFAGSGQGLAEMERNLEALARSVRRFIDDQIALDGSGGWNAAIGEVLMPMLLAWRNTTGTDLARGTGVEEIVSQAVRKRASGRGGAETGLVRHSLGLLPEKHQAVAAWLLQQEGVGLRRPHEALLLLDRYPLKVAPQHPSSVFALAGSYPGHGLHLFPSSWDQRGSFLVSLEHGASPMASPFAFGAISLAGLGRDWVPSRAKRYRWEEQFSLSRLSLHDHFHSGGGRLVHSEVRADGSGVVTIEADQFQRGTVVDNTGGPGQHIVWDKTHRPRVNLLRSVAVDYSGLSGAPALVVIVDRVRGLDANTEKTWRLDLGGVADQLAVNSNDHRFVVGNAKSGGPTLQGVFLANRPLWVRAAPYGKNRDVAVVAVADRRPSERERGEQTHQKRLGTKLADGTRAAPAGESTDNILEDFDKVLDRESRAEQTADYLLMSVITIQEGAPPAVAIQGQTAKIGRQQVRFDGTKAIIE